MSKRRELDPRSWLVSGGRPSSPGDPLNAPLAPASNYQLPAGRSYARSGGTPTWEALEAVLGGLESARAISFASGMAAAAAVFDLLKPGATVVLPDDCYHGVSALAAGRAAAGALSVERHAVSDTEAWLGAATRADLLWLESPTNPLLSIADLRAIGAAPRSEGCLLVVDNTFATPLNQQPLDVGADISMQSATKFIGGHSDLLGGVLTTRRDELFDALVESRTLLGATPGTLEAYLALRGLRTMALRLETAQASAGVLAERLAEHPRVVRTRYPGLASHPQHALAADQLGGFGSLVSFDVESAGEGDRVCAALRLIQHATSLGAVESTIERRAAVHGQEHLPPGLLRLSVGIEAVEDLWTDLDSALEA